MNINIDEMTSYHTEANLDRAVAKKLGEEASYLTVCNRDGRFVAVFPVGWNKDWMAGHIAHAGFLVVG